MQTVVLILTLFFVAANVFTEYMRRKTDNPLQQPMSAYLTGPYGVVQDYGFFALAIALVLLAVNALSVFAWSVPLILAAVALAVVVKTKRMQIGADDVKRAALEKWHLAAAGVAFSGVTFAEFRGSLTDEILFLFPLAAVCAAALFTLFRRTETAVLEKLYTILLICWITALCLEVRS